MNHKQPTINNIQLFQVGCCIGSSLLGGSKLGSALFRRRFRSIQFVLCFACLCFGIAGLLQRGIEFRLYFCNLFATFFTRTRFCLYKTSKGSNSIKNFRFTMCLPPPILCYACRQLLQRFFPLASTWQQLVSPTQKRN
jgi:hypothetical protein